MLERVLGVLKLDVATFESIEHDQNATAESAIVVAIVALLGGIGNFLDTGMTGLIYGVVLAFVTWILWSAVTFVVGTKLFGGKADLGEMLRVLGYAQAPGALNLLVAIPILGGFIGFIALIWTLVVGVVAVRQGLDFSTGKAVITVIIGFFVVAILSVVIGSILGVGAAFI